MPDPSQDATRRRPLWRVTARALAPAVSFLGALAVTRAVLAVSSSHTRAAWAGWASTSVVNLLDHPVGALIASAFVGTDDPTVWFVLGFVGLFTAGWSFGFLRTVLIVATAHVVATYVSESVLALQVLTHALSADRLTTEDVGPSYVLVAALSAGAVRGPATGRLLCVLGCAGIAPELFQELRTLDMTAVGHLTALATGAIIAYGIARLSPRPS